MFNTYRAARLGNAGRLEAASLAAQSAANRTGQAIYNAPKNAAQAFYNAPGQAIGYALTHPVATVGTAAALGGGYLANQSMGNPIGAGIQGIGNLVNGNEWDNQVGTPVDMNSYTAMNGVGSDVYQQQLNDSVMVAERSARLKQQITQEMAAQQYAQELGMRVNEQQAEREMADRRYQAEMSSQLLNGYLEAIQSAQDRAATAASNRF